MKTFKTYLEENKKSNWMLGAALAGSAALFAGGLAKHYGAFDRTEPQQQEVQQQEPQQTIKKDEEAKSEKTAEELAHENFHQGLQNKFKSEYPIILNAAKRNGIQETDHDKLAMLFAIRKTENGKHGKQFGVLHARAYAKPGESTDQSLDRQAGWASSILNKREAEWNSMSTKDQGKYDGFHHYLQTRYAPHGVQNDPRGLNKNWLGNFSTHYNDHIGFKNDQ